jgi:hypothetical protein
MARDIKHSEPTSEVRSASTEVDFALVLSRMIDALQADPQQLRSTVYALARHKLDEQAVNEDARERDRLTKALEVAIRGVEVHFTRITMPALGPPSAQLPRLGSPARGMPSVRDYSATDSEFERQPWTSSDLDREPRPGRGRWKFGTAARYLVPLAIVAVAGVAIQHFNPFALQQSHPAETATTPAQVIADRSAPMQAGPAPGPDPLIPTSFGVYAISSGKLYPLQLLPGHAPNSRVAISAAIRTPSRTVLPDPHIRFIVFRRDSAASAVDHAEVRVIAKIATAMSFDLKGKPVISNAEDSWVIRNISYPYQTAPLRGHPDMYEVLGQDADKPLGSGRYGLVLRDEVYDLTIDGEITDGKHCLESVAAANGSFYSECRKP